MRMKSCRSAAAGVAQISSPKSPTDITSHWAPGRIIATLPSRLAVMIHRAVHACLFEHRPIHRIQGGEDSSFAQHEQHILIERRGDGMLGIPFSNRHSTCDLVTSPRPPSLTAYRPFLVLLRARRYFQSAAFRNPSLSTIVKEPDFHQ